MSDRSPVARLLDWYAGAHRDLPWRRSRDPYSIWVAEVLLQQTRSETAAPYFERFVARFPTVEALAAAGVDEVLAAWSGLGYYRRARHLHEAARRVAAAGGRLPQTVEELEALPGIGPYTAAAIASQAFGVAVPVVDGNVERVVARLLALEEDPRRAAGRRRLRERAAELLDPRRPGDSNQALMELGATLCTPRRPRCPDCPLAADCRALAEGRSERYPRRRPQRPSRRQRRRVAVARQEQRVLLVRRPPGARRLAGLWELPWVDGAADGAVDSAGPGADGELRAVAAAFERRYGGRWRLAPSELRVRHAITTRRFEIEVHEAELETAGRVAEGGPGPGEVRWLSPAELAMVPLSGLTAKVLARLSRSRT